MLLDSFPLSDRFDPYLLGDSALTNGSYPGTLFRYPLRSTSERAQESQISTNVVTPADVVSYFEAFRKGSAESMLFLRSVRRIVCMEWTAGEAHPRVHFAANLESMSNDTELWEARQSIPRTLSQKLRMAEILLVKEDRMLAPFLGIDSSEAIDESVDLEEQHVLLLKSNVCNLKNMPLTGPVSAISTIHGSIETSQWIVAHRLEHLLQAQRRFLPLGLSFRKDKCFPIVGAAARLDSSCEPTGRLFCYLPLPLRSSLPVHVNGHFAVSDNRRNLLEGDDLLGKSRVLAQWNQYLLQDVLGRVYHSLLLHIPDELRDSAAPYKLWPLCEGLLDQFLGHLSDKDSLFVDVADRFCNLREAIFCQDTDDLSIEVSRLMSNLDRSIHILKPLPKPIMEGLERKFEGLTHMNPTFCISLLRAKTVPPEWTSAQRLQMLRYVSKDIDATVYLLGVALLPLADGSFGKFGDRHRFSIGPQELSLIPTQGLTRFVIGQHVDFIAACSDNLQRSIRITLAEQDRASCLKAILLCVFGHKSGELAYVDWDASSANVPNERWLTAIWTYIHQHSLEICEFEDFPLLPMATGKLKTICASLPAIHWDEARADVCCVLQKLGTPLLHPDWRSICGTVPAAFSAPLTTVPAICQWYPTNSLQRHKGLQLSVEETHCLRQFLAQLFYSQRSSIASDARRKCGQALRQVTLIRSAHCGNVLASQASILSEINACVAFVPNLDVIPVSCQDVEEKYLYEEVLGARKISWSEYYDFALQGFPLLDESTKDAFFDELVSRIDLECLSSLRSLASTAFVSTVSGSRLPPASLVDPQSNLAPLYAGEDVFPAPSFSSNPWMLRLRALGLRRDLHTREEAILCLQPAYLQASHRIAILQYFDANFDRLSSSSDHNGISCEEFKKTLRTLPWLPCDDGCVSAESARPSFERELFGEFYTTVCCQTDVWTLSNPSLLEALGWASSPPVEPIIKHIVRQTTSNVVGSADIEKLQTLYRKLEVICASDSAFADCLYNGLKSECRVTPGGQLLVTSVHRKHPWLGLELENDSFKFMSSDVLATSGENDLSPHLVVLDRTFTKSMRHLLTALRVPSRFGTDDHLRVLRSIAELPTPLLSSDLLVVNRILCKLANTTPVPESHQLFLPTTELSLLPMDTPVYYNDVPGGASTEHVAQLHPEVSHSVAQKLGIPGVSIVCLKSSMSRDFFESEQATTSMGSIKGTAMRQRSVLCARIRSILKDYPAGTTIMRELLANADDAGASRFAVTLDKTVYPCAKIPVRELQRFWGPAMVVYNDAIFSEDDFKSLCRMDEGSKGSKTTMIGKYGLGINCVYHWTDLPMILSDRFLVILDPLGVATSGGISFKYADPVLQQQFPDLLRPFERYHGFDRTKPFPGTLFRFALRDCESKLSDQICSIRDMQSLLTSSWRHESKSSLTFLRKVEELSAFVCSEMDVEPKRVWATSTHGLTDEVRLQRNLGSELPLNDGDTSMSPILYTLNIREVDSNDEDGTSSIWVIAQSAHSRSEMAPGLCEHAETRRLAPYGGLALQICASEETVLLGMDGHVHSYLPLPENHSTTDAILSSRRL